MPDIVQEYREALKRLREGKPRNVDKGARITNDSVSLEAGRKKGTIKRSRTIFKDLIDEINAAAAEQSQPDNELQAKIDGLKAERNKYRTAWEDALTREVSLVKQLWDERQEWARREAALTGEKVSSINSRRLGGNR